MADFTTQSAQSAAELLSVIAADAAYYPPAELEARAQAALDRLPSPLPDCENCGDALYCAHCGERAE